MDKAIDINVLLVSRNQAALSAFSVGLKHHQVLTTWTNSGSKALLRIAEENFSIVVADEHLGDMTGLEFIETVIFQKPMTNCAVVTSLSPADFHEVSEGLGILMPLPVRPGPEQAEKMLELLKTILKLTRQTEIKSH